MNKMSVKTVQAIVNGQTVNLSYNNSTGRYEATHELLTCSAGVVREYTFPNLPEHKISFPVLIGASSNIAGCVVARDTNATGKIKVYSPIQQDVQVLLIMLN